MFKLSSVALVAALALGAHAHIAAWSKGMYCQNGLQTEDDPNTYYIVEPLVALPYADWFMHGACKNYPPPDGEFLELPAGSSVTMEHAGDRALTTMSYNGTKTSEWPDGQDHPEGYGDVPDPNFPLDADGCIASPNMHCKDQADAAGTALAIAYVSDINAVTLDDLVVISVAANTPYKRIVSYDIPKYLPACPADGCICAWGWQPNHCGQSNEYMVPYRCKVTNVSATPKKLAAPKNPVWCESDQGSCVKGAKKMLYSWQATGNTLVVERTFTQKDGQWPSPGYNDKCGFSGGAQEDIYAAEDDSSSGSSSSSSAASSASKTTAKVTANTTKTTSTSTGTSTSTSTSTSSASSASSTSAKKCGSHLSKRSSLVRKAEQHARRRRRRAMPFLDSLGF